MNSVLLLDGRVKYFYVYYVPSGCRLLTYFMYTNSKLAGLLTFRENEVKIFGVIFSKKIHVYCRV